MRVGIDTGGTFTDVVLVNGGRITSFKIPSTPRDPAAAILQALARLGLAPQFDRRADPDPLAAGASRGPGSRPAVVHGSTVATNALLEGKTARAALLATEGFEDILEIGRQARPALYEIEVQRPKPLVPRPLRFGVRERVLASGAVRTPLDRESVLTAARAAAAAGAESLAVCFLHSYLRPEHEQEAASLARGIFPGAITVSSDLLREFREYERCSTAVVNAAVAPIVGAYLERLAAALPDVSLRIMGSNGGALSVRRAVAEAVRTVLSGPAAGVVAARRVCAAEGITQVISFDMGGTSTDVSLIPGDILLTGETVVAGYPIRTPTVDIHTAGAGGGSIAWIDAGGALKVGPASAGADPGPACYNRGGPPTVTDAHVVLGRIDPDRFLGGQMRLEASAAARAIAEIASRVGRSPEETAWGILQVVNAIMARALRYVSLFRGHDPAAFTLCAFGGAGGLHAADLADAAGIGDVFIPAGPGVFSAWGLLAGDIVVDRSATVLLAASSHDPGALRRAFAPLEEAVAEALAAEHTADADVEARPVLEHVIEARYRGQSHELQVKAEGDWIEAFHAEHRSRYGFDRRGEEVVAVTLRVFGRLAVAPPPSMPSADDPAASAPRPRRIWDRGAWRDGVVVSRAALTPGHVVSGPAVVAESGATIYVPFGCEAHVAAGGSLRLRKQA